MSRSPSTSAWKRLSPQQLALLEHLGEPMLLCSDDGRTVRWEQVHTARALERRGLVTLTGGPGSYMAKLTLAGEDALHDVLLQIERLPNPERRHG